MIAIVPWACNLIPSARAGLPDVSLRLECFLDSLQQNSPTVTERRMRPQLSTSPDRLQALSSLPAEVANRNHQSICHRDKNQKQWRPTADKVHWKTSQLVPGSAAKLLDELRSGLCRISWIAVRQRCLLKLTKGVRQRCLGKVGCTLTGPQTSGATLSSSQVTSRLRRTNWHLIDFRAAEDDHACLMEIFSWLLKRCN